ncbi:helix-hairpin-helix domain-containing protein [Prochlorococcus sp. AH-736-L23]|nr:helix-hairpin-helix domain-containing protein [Prochlorococcus sp. AH-736-L23]
MNLLNYFFRNWNKREEVIFEDPLENSNDLWAHSVTTGWEYTCNLLLKTPRICIEKDGLITKDTSVKPELIGEPNNLGKDGDPSGNFGCWIRRHGHEEEFEELVNISQNMIYARPSDIGRIPPKSKLEDDFKSFLIDFRIIVESNISIEKKLFMINDELSIKSEGYKDIYKKLVLEKKFPDSFFRNILCELNGVSKNTAEILWESGYLTKEQVLNAPYSELIEIKGLGKSLISKIKN